MLWRGCRCGRAVWIMIMAPATESAPISVSTRSLERIAKAPNAVALRPGMIVSNEPGYYKAGEYGIRIENLRFITEPRARPGGDRPMLGFETLTFAPIDRRLIDVREQLTAAERRQLDEYHARTLAVIGAGLAEPARSWLVGACAPI